MDLSTLKAEVALAWNKAEGAVKLAEQVNGQVINPAIYELRYAGRKLVEAYELEMNGKAEQAAIILRDAQLDCMRARHDAVDAATSKVLVHLELAVGNLGASRVLSAFPKWSETYKHLVDVRAQIVTSREHRNDRERIYTLIETADLPQIVKLYDEFCAQEPRLIREAKIGRWKEVGLWGLTIASLVLAVVSLLK